MASDNNKMIKGLAFEKAVLEILKKRNPIFEDEKNKTIENQYYRHDAVYHNKLVLTDFGLSIIYGNRIVVEFKAGKVAKETVEHFLKQTEGQFDAVVFFFAYNTPKAIRKTGYYGSIPVKPDFQGKYPLCYFVV